MEHSTGRAMKTWGRWGAHLSATSKVAPPHISRLAQGARILDVAGAALSMSCVRMRVASRLWCASRLQATCSSTMRTLLLQQWRSSPPHAHRRRQWRPLYQAVWFAAFALPDMQSWAASSKGSGGDVDPSRAWPSARHWPLRPRKSGGNSITVGQESLGRHGGACAECGGLESQPTGCRLERILSLMGTVDTPSGSTP